jgi:hypothetical protein
VRPPLAPSSLSTSLIDVARSFCNCRRQEGRGPEVRGRHHSDGGSPRQRGQGGPRRPPGRVAAAERASYSCRRGRQGALCDRHERNGRLCVFHEALADHLSDVAS